MAKFIVNSTNTTAVRIEQINSLVIGEDALEGWYLYLGGENIPKSILFEKGATLEEIQTKAAAVIATLEE